MTSTYLKLEVKMVIGGAEGIGISYYSNQFFKFQFSLKIIDRNQTAMLSDLMKQIFSSNAIFLVKFWIEPRYLLTTFL